MMRAAHQAPARAPYPVTNASVNACTYACTHAHKHTHNELPWPGQLEAPSDDEHTHTPGVSAHPTTAVSTEHTLTPRNKPDAADKDSDGATNDPTSYVYPSTVMGEAHAATTGAAVPPAHEKLAGHAAQDLSSAEPAAQYESTAHRQRI
jgi:hypothetical protein